MISNRCNWLRTVGALTLSAFVLALSVGTFAQDKSECPVRVTLLQVNDVYQFAPVDGGKNGGLGRVLTLRKQIMRESPHTLFLFSGDTISPSIESNTVDGGQMMKGRQMIEAWNLIGLDYATLGNHEFDFGPDTLHQRIRESRFKWLVANVFDKKTGKLLADTQEFAVREFDGVKIGIFGLLLRETLQTSQTGPDIEIGEPCAAAARVIPKIRAAGAQVIVALTHLPMSEDKQLARCAGVDIIIGGHEHTLLESLAGHAPIFKMTSDARELGRIDLNIARTTGKLESIDWKIYPVNQTVASDPDFAPLNEKYGALLKRLEEVIGRTEVELDLRSEHVRTRETNMADFIADTYCAATGADVALVNGGSLRADTVINQGEVTRRDVLSIVPFNNRIVKIEITGAVLRAALEHAVASFGTETEPGRFAQVSGVRYAYDARRQPGARLTGVSVNGKQLDDKQIYTLAASDYVVLKGGDGYKMFSNAKILIGPEQGPAEADVLIKAITAATSIAPKVDGRITRVDVAKDANACP
ncbi:MAG TPA: 5'-nucleotidase C-terminal domain-containing protein [Pyrinomonadaceae bacterium]|nr:5'-nucleotidase C-terminal domain-containing protein [Pyrinomonadaceae bacterium]